MKVPEDRDRLTFCGFKKREPLQFSNVRFGSKSAVEAFKVWASKEITAGQEFSKCALEAKTSLKHLNIVSEAKYKTWRAF